MPRSVAEHRIRHRMRKYRGARQTEIRLQCWQPTQRKKGIRLAQGNAIRDKMAAGKTVLGCFLGIGSPQIVEMLGLAGFDFVLIDAEHGPISPETAYPMILAAEARGIEAFARVGELDKQVMLKYLDLGITGLMAPQISNADQAEIAISATKYATRGNRGLAGGRVFDFGLRDTASDMAPRINDGVLNMIQFEHIDALSELDAILDTPNLDVLFVGPNDLAQSLGMPGKPNHQDVTDIADQVVARCKARGVKTGTTFGDAKSAHATMARGFDMLVANAPSVFALSLQTLVNGIRTLT